MTDQSKAYLYAFSAVLLWSTVATAFKIALIDLDPLQLLLISALVSLIGLFIMAIANSSIRHVLEYSPAQILRSAAMAILNPFLYYIILFKAYEILPAQEAQPLNYTWPIMLVLLSIPLLGQKISIKSILAVGICFLGVLTISTQGDILGFKFTNLEGALLALSTAVIWALFWILNMKDNRDGLLKLMLSFAFGLVYIVIFVYLFSDFKITFGKSVWAASYVGLFEMGICFVLWSKALHLTDTTAKVSKFVYLVPVLSLVFIYIILGEKILLSTVLGLVIILAGIVLERLGRA